MKQVQAGACRCMQVNASVGEGGVVGMVASCGYDDHGDDNYYDFLKTTQIKKGIYEMGKVCI